MHIIRNFFQAKTALANLWCEYQSHEAPYRRFKVEVVHADPWIVMYYDVISDDKIKEIKTMAKPSVSYPVF